MATQTSEDGMGMGMPAAGLGGDSDKI